MRHIKNFRTDINGLRAIAVMSVALFHFNANSISGGFVGVDVFFVISGFLMTKIIFRGLQDNSFCIFKFYVARANRIIPALTTVCLAILILGWFILPPIEYRALGKHVASSVGFISNIIYWKESGYFDTPSYNKWLLHTWSLSVEWQFYTLYPLVLVAIHHFTSIKILKRLVILGALISFISSIYITLYHPNPAYYLFPTRAWEMLFGGLVYLYPISFTKNNRKIFIEYSGVLLILISCLFFSKTNLWPGYLAFIPVFGASLILVANHQKSKITNNILFQSIGNWSYSIYLWHWPVVVFGYYFNISHWMYIGMPISVFLGWLSYQYIECKKFDLYIHWRQFFYVKPVFFVIIVGILGTAVYLTNGMYFHYPNNILVASNEANDYSPYRTTCFRDGQICYFENNKKIEKQDKVDYVLFGDSHSLAQLTAVVRSIPKDKKLVYIGGSSCLFIPNLDSKYDDITSCKIKTNKLYNTIIENNKKAKLIMIERTNIYFTGYNENESQDKMESIRFYSGKLKINAKKQYVDSLCKLAKKNEVFVSKLTPEFPFNIPRETSKRVIIGEKNQVKIDKNQYNKRNENTKYLFKKLALCNIKIMDPTKYLCKHNQCFTLENNRPIYKDDDHLSEYGSRLLIPMFKQYLR